MKALYIYSKNKISDINIIERAQSEMGQFITILELESVPNILKSFIRDTPAIIIVTDELQGQYIMGEGVDGKLLVTAMLNRRMEEEDLVIHQAETYRLDNFVRAENTKAIDNYTLELIEGGLL